MRLSKYFPVRSCVVCRKSGGKELFYAICKLKSGEFLFDADAEIDGRHFYFCREVECWRKLRVRILKGGFAVEKRILLKEEVLGQIDEVFEAGLRLRGS